MADVDEDIILVEDVTNEGTIIGSALDDQIEYRIPKSTDNILYDELKIEEDSEIEEILADRKESMYLKWAIIYDVLAWLEREGKIDGKNMDVTSIKDSQVSVTVQRRKGALQQNISESYSELRDDYIRKLINKLPPVGGASIRGRY